MKQRRKFRSLQIQL